MRVSIKPEFQVKRINQLEQDLDKISQLDWQILVQRPSEKSWAPVEVVRHMVLAHSVYREKVQSALQYTSDTPIQTEFRTGFMASYLIKRFPPKDGKIQMKMKTMKKFEPTLDVNSLSEEKVRVLLQELRDVLNELKDWVNHYRTKAVSLKKFNSAIGPMVRFHLPEACEFILCHNERHFFQIEKSVG